MQIGYLGNYVNVSLNRGIVPLISNRIPKAYGITRRDVAVCLVGFAAMSEDTRRSVKTEYRNGSYGCLRHLLDGAPTIILEYDGSYVSDDVAWVVYNKMLSLDKDGIIRI